MRTSLIITALMASVALAGVGCDDPAATASRAPKTAEPSGTQAGDEKVDKSKIKVHEEYLPTAQKEVTADNLDDAVSKLEDEILTESNE